MHSLKSPGTHGQGGLHAAFRGFCPEGSPWRQFPGYGTRGVQDFPGYLRLLPGGPFPRRGAHDVRQRQHSGDVLPGFRKGGAELQPDGRFQGALEACTRYLAYDLGRARGIRVNCISAGPMQTLAARGVSGFNTMFKVYEEHAPLGRSCTGEELGATGVFLASDGAAAITGQVIYVDGGYQIMGM